MWQAFINWLKGLFESKDSDDSSAEEFPFTGVIEDEPDARDQIFGETK